MTVSLTADKEIEADIQRRWAAIFKPEDLNLTPEQVFNDVNFLLFQLERFQRAHKTLAEDLLGVIVSMTALQALPECIVSELEARLRND